MPLTGAADNVELMRLRDWYRHGIPRRWGEPERRAADQLFDLLARIGGPDLVGPISAVPAGTFWPVSWQPQADERGRTRSLCSTVLLFRVTQIFGNSTSSHHARAPRRYRDLLTRLASAAVFLVAWQIAAEVAQSRLLPGVIAVLRAMAQQTRSGALPWNLAITLGRVAAAFMISLLLGSALGIAMGRSRRLDLWLDNAVTVLLNLPALVLIVLLYVWFGLNEVAAIVAVALNKLPTTVVTMREGARTLDPRLSPKWHGVFTCRAGAICGM